MLNDLWDRVDRALAMISERFATAKHEEDFQAIGLTAREILISLGQAIYDPERHGSMLDVEPSSTDANRMLEGYLASELGGSGNKEARKYVRAAWDLAVALQHRRTATMKDAELCALVTEAVVSLISFLEGRTAHNVSGLWEGIELDGRYFAWSGPTLHNLLDRDPVPVPPKLTDSLRAADLTHRLGLISKLTHHLAQGYLQVFETDRGQWRRSVRDGAGKALLVKSDNRG